MRLWFWLIPVSKSAAGSGNEEQALTVSGAWLDKVRLSFVVAHN
jgi:hypothetical protein